MYAQVEKPKKNKRKAVANTVTQKKSSGPQGFGLVDNRPKDAVQKRAPEIANNGGDLKQVTMFHDNATINGGAKPPRQLMWSSDNKTKIQTLVDLNTVLTAMNAPNINHQGKTFKGATLSSIDNMISQSDFSCYNGIRAYDIYNEIQYLVEITFIDPERHTKYEYDEWYAWIDENNKGVTELARKHLIAIANGDKTKIHRSIKVKGVPTNTPYVHDKGSNYICTYDLEEPNWDGNPMIKVLLDGNVNGGIHKFS